MLETLLEIAKYLLPSIVVLIAAYATLSSLLNSQLADRRLELAAESRRNNLPIKLQAYERLVLLLERINLQSLIPRVRSEDMTLPEFHYALVTSVRMELEHNITQQLYVSPHAWTVVKGAAEQTISIINAMAAQMPENASTTDFSRAIIQHILDKGGVLPTQQALEILHAEAASLLN